MPSTFFINLAGSTFLWWLAVYLLSRNTRSKIAWISASFLACLSIYILANNVSRQLTVYDYYTWLWHLTDWSYILPIALIFHFSVVVTGKEKQRANKILTILMYLAAAMLIYLSTSTELLVSNDIKDFVPGIGYLNPRGPFFWLIAPFVAFASIGAIYTYVRALKEQSHLDHQKKVKYLLAVISSSLYLIVGPVIVLLYYAPIESLAVQWSPVLISLPFIPMLVAILFYRLVSDVDYIFNWKEFSYLTLTIFLLSALNASIFIIFIAPHIGELAYIFAAVFSFITIFTHGFYDWLTTLIRDLIYNTGKGFSLITDADVNDLVTDFHRHEKLETNAILKFKALKRRGEDGKLIDAAQELTREAIEFFKQSDFPRRTKQNLKYQLLKMLTLNDAEEGQILWELGFEGYPVKIMNGESATRRPLFKVESMSDYTAISRNAYIALKKEAIHDLAWRLSYLEKLSK